jgi:hypothetical protein
MSIDESAGEWRHGKNRSSQEAEATSAELVEAGDAIIQARRENLLTALLHRYRLYTRKGCARATSEARAPGGFARHGSTMTGGHLDLPLPAALQSAARNFGDLAICRGRKAAVS